MDVFSPLSHIRSGNWLIHKSHPVQPPMSAYPSSSQRPIEMTNAVIFHLAEDVYRMASGKW